MKTDVMMPCGARSHMLRSHDTLHQKQPIEKARDYYTLFLSSFPFAARYWRQYIQHELSAGCVHHMAIIVCVTLTPLQQQ